MDETCTSDLAGIKTLPAFPARLDDATVVPELLRKHVVNLEMGRLSTGGDDTTSPEDVEQIFTTHLPTFANDELGKDTADVPILLFAHGGLVDEQAGTAIAALQAAWWRSLGVYPVFFTWEAGLRDHLGRAIRQALLPGLKARTISPQTITNEVIERAVRAAHCGAVWESMKISAALCSEEGGGAYLVAQHLSDYCRAAMRATGRRVPLHAVGHSAGSIFHAHFLAISKELRVPQFRTLQLLAPAVRIDTFKALTAPLIPGHVQRLAIFTMNSDLEEKDHVKTLYKRSLLHLIREALETEEHTDLLGLQVCLQSDPALEKLGDVIYSTTANEPGNGCCSCATSHGEFDNDPHTMRSVAYRVLSAN